MNRQCRGHSDIIGHKSSPQSNEEYWFSFCSLTVCCTLISKNVVEFSVVTESSHMLTAWAEHTCIISTHIRSSRIAPQKLTSYLLLFSHIPWHRRPLLWIVWFYVLCRWKYTQSTILYLASFILHAVYYVLHFYYCVAFHSWILFVHSTFNRDLDIFFFRWGQNYS